MQISKKIEIRANPETVFEFISDATLMSSLTPFHKVVRSEKEEKIGVGTKIKWTIPLRGGKMVSWTQEITEYEPAKKITLVSSDRSLTETFNITPTVEGCELKLEQNTDLKIGRQQMERAATSQLNNIKEAIETDYTKEALQK